MRRGRRAQTEDRLHHALNLVLLRASVAADRLLDGRRRVLAAVNGGESARDEHGAAGLTDRERGAGVGADERLLERDGIRAVLLDETLDALEDRLQTSRQMLAGARAPPPEVHGPEAPVVFVDDSVSACSRAWVDAEDS